MAPTPHPGVSLVELTAGHLPAVRAWLADDDLRDRVGTATYPSEAEHERWFERLIADRTRLARLVINDSGHPMGLCGFRAIEPLYRRAEVWIYVGDATARTRGVGSAALARLLDFGFGALSLHRVEARVFSFNEPARRFFLAHGFRPEGVERDGVFKHDQFYDVWRLAMLEHERP